MAIGNLNERALLERITQTLASSKRLTRVVLSAEQVRELLESYVEGYSVTTLARRYGCCRRTIYRYLHKAAGITPNAIQGATE